MPHMKEAGRPESMPQGHPAGVALGQVSKSPCGETGLQWGASWAAGPGCENPGWKNSINIDS